MSSWRTELALGLTDEDRETTSNGGVLAFTDNSARWSPLTCIDCGKRVTKKYELHWKETNESFDKLRCAACLTRYVSAKLEEIGKRLSAKHVTPVSTNHWMRRPPNRRGKS